MFMNNKPTFKTNLFQIFVILNHFSFLKIFFIATTHIIELRISFHHLHSAIATNLSL